MQTFRFDPCELPESAEALRQEVRDFLNKELPDYPVRKRAETWMGFDADFSRKVGEQGWIGMTCSPAKWANRAGSA